MGSENMSTVHAPTAAARRPARYRRLAAEPIPYSLFPIPYTCPVSLLRWKNPQGRRFSPGDFHMDVFPPTEKGTRFLSGCLICFLRRCLEVEHQKYSGDYHANQSGNQQ